MPAKFPGAPVARLAAEVSEYLVVSTVFKTAEPESLGLAGSIPVHLRQRIER